MPATIGKQISSRQANNDNTDSGLSAGLDSGVHDIEVRNRKPTDPVGSKGGETELKAMATNNDSYVYYAGIKAQASP